MKAWERRVDKTKGVSRCCSLGQSSRSVIFLVITFTMISLFTLVFGSVVMYLVDTIADLEGRMDELQTDVEKYRTNVEGLKRILFKNNVSSEET